MAVTLPTDGTVFASTQVAENSFIPDFTNYNVSGIISIPDPGFGITDADSGDSDQQLVMNATSSTADAYRLGTLELQDQTIGGADQGPPTTFDILGASTNANGSTYYLLGQQPMVPGNPPSWQGYVLVSTDDISTVDNDTPNFPITITRSGSATDPLTPDDVAQALNGIVIDPAGQTSDIQQLKSTKITANGDGSYTIGENAAFVGAAPGAGTTITYVGTIETTAGTYVQGAISAVINGSPQTLVVIGFTGTQVLVEGYTVTTAGTYQLNTNRYLITTGGPDTAIQIGNANPGTLTVYPTGASYTAPNGTTFPCFARGTRIATPNGEVAVEDIAVGDLLLTHGGVARPVVWVGSRTINVARHPHPENVRPVVIRKDAFADNVPARDLVVSPDHNVFVDGVLIPAKCLVNGHNVVVADVATVSYHHVELEQHDVVFAEGLPAETYLDAGNRSDFAGAATMTAYPDFASLPDLNYFAWEANGCARLVLAGPELDAVRVMLASRAAGAAARIANAA